MLGRIAAAAVILIAGCSAPEPPRPDSQRSSVRLEYARASCMRAKGFKYEPFIRPDKPLTAEQVKLMAGDYTAMLARRERYGYQVFSMLAYPDDPAADGVNTSYDDHANGKSITSLSRTQAAAWWTADRACFSQAVERLLGKRAKDDADLNKQMNRAFTAEEERTIDADPTLVALARDYGRCLRAHGYPVPSVRPSRVSTLEEDRFLRLAFDLGREEQGSKAQPGMDYLPQGLTPAQAMPYLKREIKSARDDLECGRDFIPAYLPRERALNERLQREWGFD